MAMHHQLKKLGGRTLVFLLGTTLHESRTRQMRPKQEDRLVAVSTSFSDGCARDDSAWLSMFPKDSACAKLSRFMMTRAWCVKSDLDAAVIACVAFRSHIPTMCCI